MYLPISRLRQSSTPNILSRVFVYKRVRACVFCALGPAMTVIIGVWFPHPVEINTITQYDIQIFIFLKTVKNWKTSR